MRRLNISSFVMVVFSLAFSTCLMAQTRLVPERLPVVFIPGIAGSKLIGGGETGKNGNGEYLWPTLDPDDITSLKLGGGGAADVQAVDVVDFYNPIADGLPILDVPVYRRLLDYFTGGLFGYRLMNLDEDRTRITSDWMLRKAFCDPPDFFVFPYDWRLSNAQHIGDLQAYIKTIRKLHEGRKVNIIAHSMGGLLMRRYILKNPKDIHCAVTIGSPFLGAPKGIYRMLTGDFYDKAPVDLVTNRAMRRALSSFPAVFELLPSDLFLSQDTTAHAINGVSIGGKQVFSQLRWDAALNKFIRDDFDTQRYKSFINDRVMDLLGGPPDNKLPYGVNGITGVNEAFHNYDSQRQDNWFKDNSSIHYFHIAGRHLQPSTTIRVLRRLIPRPLNTPIPGSTDSFLQPPVVLQPPVEYFQEELGWGDKVVPEFSSLRIKSLLAPNTQDRPPFSAAVSDNKVEHTELTQNDEVLAAIDSFLISKATLKSVSGPPTRGGVCGDGSDTTARTFALPKEPPPPPSPLILANPTHFDITMIGLGYVNLQDGDGNQNTLLSTIAAKPMPGLEVKYGGDQPYVAIRGGLPTGLTLSAAGNSQAIDIVILRSPNVSAAVEWMQRYRFNPGTRNWRIILPAAGVVTSPIANIDVNGDSVFGADEALAAQVSLSGSAVDVQRPRLHASLSRVGPQTRLSFIADDPEAGAPVVRYAVDGGEVQVNSGSTGLLFGASETHVIQSYAEDASGNTSDMVTTHLPPPAFSSQSCLWPMGARLDLEVTPEEDVAYQWLKNGAAIAKAAGRAYTIHSPSLSSAGTYAVRGSRTGASPTSESCVIGIVDTAPRFSTVNEGAALTLQAVASAPGKLSYQWRKDGREMTDMKLGKREVKGSKTANLSITPFSADDAGQYACIVFLADPYVSSAVLEHSTGSYTVTGRYKPVIEAPAPAEAIVSGKFLWQLTADHEPTSFIVTGLPSGLTLNASTGLIQGTPNTSGEFIVRVSAKNALGVGAVREFTLRVAPLPIGVAGTQTGLISRNAVLNGMLGGWFSLTVTSTGAYSGTVMNGSLRYSIKGRLETYLTSGQGQVSGTKAPLPRVGKSPFEIFFSFNSAERFISGTVTGSVDNRFSGTSLSGRRAMFAGTTAAQYSGIYNSFSGSVSTLTQPQGSGFQQLQAGSSGLVTVSGRTPDGLAYTFGGAMWEDGTLPELIVLYGGKGSLTGMPRIVPPDLLLLTSVEGWLEQYKSGPTATNDRLYGTGIPLLRRSLTGGKYFKPDAALPIVLGKAEGVDNASISFLRGGIESAAQFAATGQKFQITTGNKAVFASAKTTNPCNVQMTINSNSGFFEGSMSLTDTVSGKPVTRTVRYYGILISFLKRGYGMFILPGTSPSVSTAPVLTGSVTLN